MLEYTHSWVHQSLATPAAIAAKTSSVPRHRYAYSGEFYFKVPVCKYSCNNDDRHSSPIIEKYDDEID